MIDRETLARKMLAVAFPSLTWGKTTDDGLRADFRERAAAEIARFNAMGLAIVPIEATERMIDAGIGAPTTTGPFDNSPVDEDSVNAVWSAMLKAAGERG